MPAPMMRETHSPASSELGKPTSTARAVSGFFRMRTVTSVTTPSRPSEPVMMPEQVVAAGVEMLAAEAQHLAGHQHDLAAEHVVGGHAVFQAMHAAGILRHVAADGAGDLRGRIGRVIEAGIGDRVADREIGDAGLHHHDAVVEVDVADAVELGHAEQHAVGERQRAAGERGAGPARHHLDAFVVAIAQHLRDLLGGLRQHHHHGQLLVGGQPVGSRKAASRARPRSRPRPARWCAARRRCARAAPAPRRPPRASAPTL